MPNIDYPNGYIAELGAVYTTPKYRRQGIAIKLLDNILINVNNDLPGISAIVVDVSYEFYRIAQKQNYSNETKNIEFCGK